MLLIPCPWCGEREETEFHHGGEAHATARSGRSRKDIQVAQEPPAQAVRDQNNAAVDLVCLRPVCAPAQSDAMPGVAQRCQ